MSENRFEIIFEQIDEIAKYDKLWIDTIKDTMIQSDEIRELARIIDEISDSDEFLLYSGS